MKSAKRPGGGQEVKRDLHFFWLVDSSGSMTGQKIMSLNFAIQEAIPEMRRAAQGNTSDRVLVHVVRFASDVEWMTNKPVPLSEFHWTDIKAGGETTMGAAIASVADRLAELQKQQESRYVPPVLILITDGLPTDAEAYKESLRRLMDLEFGKKATRLAVAIGDDANFGYLQDFIANPELSPLQAHRTDELAALISFASTAAIEQSSTGRSKLQKGAKAPPVDAKPPVSDGSNPWIVS
jgi:uncharacterized protein YegL